MINIVMIVPQFAVLEPFRPGAIDTNWLPDYPQAMDIHRPKER